MFPASGSRKISFPVLEAHLAVFLGSMLQVQSIQTSQIRKVSPPAPPHRHSETKQGQAGFYLQALCHILEPLYTKKTFPDNITWQLLPFLLPLAATSDQPAGDALQRQAVEQRPELTSELRSGPARKRLLSVHRWQRSGQSSCFKNESSDDLQLGKIAKSMCSLMRLGF